MSSKEIEIKLQLEESDYIRLEKLLDEMASSKIQKHQIDVYYSPLGNSFYDSGDRCLRVRTEGDSTILSYKRIFEENTNKQFIEEYETCVDNFEMIDNILKGLCFWREITVDKFRVEYFLETGFLVALDKVQNLGYFIEVENCNENDELEKRNQDLYVFVQQLQVDLTHRNTEGYSNMIFRRKHIQRESKL